MRPEEKDLGYLWDIASACRLALEFIQGIDRNAFEDDLKSQAAIIRQIEVIGEAANRLSDDFRKFNDHIPWSDMIGMRNILIHQYDRVNLNEVWTVVAESLPDLLKQVQDFLSDPLA